MQKYCYPKIVRGNDLMGQSLNAFEGGDSGTAFNPLNVPHLLLRTHLQKREFSISLPINVYFFLLLICIMERSPIHLFASGWMIASEAIQITVHARYIMCSLLML